MRTRKPPKEVWLHCTRDGDWSFSFDPPRKRYAHQFHRMVPAQPIETAVDATLDVAAELARVTAERDAHSCDAQRWAETARIAQRELAEVTKQRDIAMEIKNQQRARAEMAERDLATCRAMREQEMMATLDLRAQVAALRAVLADAEEKLSSAAHVAGEYVTANRTVSETNWRPLRDRLRETRAAVTAALAAPNLGADFVSRAQLRFVARAMRLACVEKVRRPEGPEGEDGYSLERIADAIEAIDLDAVIAEACK